MDKANPSAHLSPAPGSLGRSVLWIASVALVYFAAARLSLLFVFKPEGFTAIWPPEGIFLSAILLTRRNLRPWLVGVLCITDFVAEKLSGTPIFVSVIFALTLAGDAVLSSWLLLRFVGGPITFRRVREVLGFLALAVIFSNALLSLAAAAAAQLLPGTSFWNSWAWWAAPNGIGNLLVTPFILSWAAWARTKSDPAKPKRGLEGAALFVLLALLNYVLFGHLSEHKLFGLFFPYLTFPFLLWAALRFGVRGTATVMAILAAVTVPSVIAGRVPSFSLVPGILDDVIIVQLFLAIMAIPSLFLAAVVTERQEAHEAMRESQASLEAAQEQAHLGNWDLDPAAQRGHWSREMFRLFGRDPALGPPAFEEFLQLVHPEDRPRVLELHAHVRQTGELRTVDFRGNPERGLVRRFNASVHGVCDAAGRVVRLAGTVLEITGREQAQQALRENEERLARIVETTPAGIAIVNRNGRITFANPAAEEILGLTRSGITARAYNDPAWKITTADGRTFPDEEQPFTRVMRSNQPAHGIEQAIEHPDGRRVVLVINAAPLRDDAGTAVGVVDSFTDITQRKAQEREIERLNRLYITLSEINQAIVRSHTRDELYQKTCRALVEFGGFNLAWFGMVDKDTSEVGVVGRAGDKSGYLDSLQVFADDRPEGRGITGTAIREARPYICNDFFNDPRTLLWHKAAAKAGFRAAAAFPVRLAGRVAGALNVYANKVGFFGEEEIALLEETTEDINFAFDNLDNEVRRQQAEEALREKEHLLSESQRIAHVGTWSMEIGTDKILWTDETFRIYGVTPASFVPTVGTLVGLIHPDDRPAMQEWIRACLAGEHPADLEFRAVLPDGNVRTLSGRGDLQCTPDHTPIRILGTVQDITERKQAEEALHRHTKEIVALNSLTREVSSSLSLETVAASAVREMFNAVKPDLVFLFLREGERLVMRGVAPESARERLGQIPEHRVGECLCGLAVQQGQPLYSRDIFSDLRCTWEECKKAGFRSFAALPLRASGEIIGVIGLASDAERDFEPQAAFLETLTNAAAVSLQNAWLFAETKQAQETLLESEARLAAFMRFAPALVLIKDHELRPVFANNNYKQVFPFDEWIGKKPHELFPPDVANSMVAKDTEALEKGYSSYEENWTDQQGRQHVFFTQKFRINIPDKEPLLGAIISDITERNQAEQRITDALNFNQTVLNASPVGIVVFKASGPCFSTNEALAQLLGGTIETIQAQNFRRLESWKRSGLLAAAETALATQSEREFDTRFVTTFGKEVWLSFRLVPFHYAGEAHLLALVTDIAGRKQAEEAVRESEERFRTAFEMAPDGMCLVSPAGRFLRVNEAFFQMLGYSENELLSMTFMQVTHPEDLAASQEWIRRALAGEPKSTDLEKRYQHKTGRVVWGIVRVNLLRKPDGSPLFFVAHVQDITEHKQAEEEHIRLATAIKQTAEAILITDTKGTILYVNPAFEKTTGYSQMDALGQNPRILRSGKHDDAFYRQLWQTITRGEIWTGRFINRKKNGDLCEQEATISPVRNSTGKIVNYVGVQHDVTQEVALETQLRQAQKMEAIGQLAGGVAHDFNNILTIIQGNASLLLLDKPTEAEVQEGTQQIVRAAERAANLTRQLLLFSRRQALQPVNLDLTEVVSGMTKMLRRLLGEDITLQTEFAPDLPPVFGDAGMIEQVLLNLAVNSRDAMPKGGRLTIATGTKLLDQEPTPQNPDSAPGLHVWLEVSDTGCGIAPEHLPHIFEPFFTTKETGKGTGLGLATVYGIVHQHHGSINMTSEIGKGTTCRIYFPVTAGAKEKEKTAADVSALPHGQETILIVEDDLSVRLLATRLLQRCGYNLLQADSGKAALKVWREHKGQIRLLLTDMVMPGGLSGRELAEQLSRENDKLKVIYTSGYSLEFTTKELALIEGQNFLQKPFSPLKLARTVRNVLDQQ